MQSLSVNGLLLRDCRAQDQIWTISGQERTADRVSMYLQLICLKSLVRLLIEDVVFTTPQGLDLTWDWQPVNQQKQMWDEHTVAASSSE